MQTIIIILAVLLLFINLFSIVNRELAVNDLMITPLSVEILTGFLLVLLMINILAGSDKLRIYLPQNSPTILLSLPTSSRNILLFFFYKQVLIQGLFSLFAIYFMAAALLRTVVPVGLFISWIGYWLFTVWLQSLSLLAYSLNKKIKYNLRLLLGLFFASITAYFLGVLFFEGLSEFIKSFQSLSLAEKWPFNWFIPLIYYTFDSTAVLSIVNFLRLGALNMITLLVAYFLIGDCRDDIFKIVNNLEKK